MPHAPEVVWTHPGLPQILDAIPVGMNSLLDAGCGRGIIGALCRIYRGANRQVGLEGHQPYLDFCAHHKLYDELRLMRLEQPLPFDDHEFDVATCIEVIEHLPRESGLRLIDELERVARVVIITTPTVYYSQEALDANPLQQHRSGWSVADFRKRGYQVRGAAGMKVFGRHVKFVSSACAPLVRFVPSLSETMLCRK